MVRLGRRQKSRRWARIGQTLRERSPTRRASTFLSMSEGRKRDGSSGREAASAKPRCLRHPKTRPACAPRLRALSSCAPRPQTDAEGGGQAGLHNVSEG